MNKDIIKRFLNGSCSKEEQKRVIDWSNSEYFELELEDILRDDWDQNDHSFEAGHSEPLFNKIQTRIENLEESGSNLQKLKDRKAHSVYKFLKYAAAIAMVAMVAYFVRSGDLLNSSKETVESEMIRKATTKGQKSTFYLTDGSKVILNSQSILSFPKAFTDSTRNITLDGEAYFEVAKDKSRPFTVTVGNIVTTALGTSFNINSQSDNVMVSLADGKVLVYEKSEGAVGNQQYILTPGEMLIHNKEQGRFAKTTFDYKETFLWKEGIMYFKDASFEEVVDKLSVWYNVQFEVANSPEIIKPYTGEFNNESLENVLVSMGFSLDFDYFLNGAKVKIIFNK